MIVRTPVSSARISCIFNEVQIFYLYKHNLISMRLSTLLAAFILVYPNVGYGQSPCSDLVPSDLQIVGPETSDFFVEICQGESFVLAMSAPANLSVLICNWGDLTSDTFTSLNSLDTLELNHAYLTPGSYPIEVTAVDSYGCTWSNNEMMVLVATEPEFNLNFPSTVCQGTPFEINSDELTFPEFVPVTSLLSQELVILDDVGEYSSEIVVDQFPPGQVVTACNDLTITANLEHSFIGDLTLLVECPNGTEVILMDNGPDGTPDPTECAIEDLGNVDLGIVNVEGIDYTWTMEADWVLDDATNPNVQNPMPSGEYLPCGDLCDLEGCPWNGAWKFTVLDQWAGDDGTLFGWSMNVDPELLCLDQMPFQPQAGQSSDSSFWYLQGTGEPLSLDNSFVLSLDANGSSAEIVLNEIGETNFGYLVTNDFGCTWDTTLSIEVLDPPAFSLSTPTDVVVGCGLDDLLELEVNLSVGDSLTSCSQSGTYSHCAGPNDNTIFSYCPDSPGDGTVMSLDFLAGALEYGWDYVTIYDGQDATGPVLAILSEEITGQSFVASNPLGCLSFQFSTDLGCDCAGFCSFDPIEWCVGCLAEQSACSFNWEWMPEEFIANSQGGHATIQSFEGDSLAISVAVTPPGIDACATVQDILIRNAIDWEFEVIHPNCLNEEGGIELTVTSLTTDQPISIELWRLNEDEWELIESIVELSVGSHLWGNLSSSEYEIRLSGPQCESETRVELIQAPAPLLEVNAPSSACPDSEFDVSAELLFGGGSTEDSTWHVIWSNGSVGDSTLLNSQDVPVFATASNSIGCIADTFQFTVPIFPPLQVEFEQDTIFGCGAVAQLVRRSVQGGSGEFQYEWSNLEVVQGNSGDYTLIATTISDSLCLQVQDENCAYSDSECIEIVIEEIPAGDCDCIGTSIPEEYCNCQGDVADVVGQCGGNCLLDVDADGVCDCAESLVHLEDAEFTGISNCQAMSLSVDSIPEGATLTELFVTIEHSYLGDLEFVLESPLGNSIVLKSFGVGGWTLLGLPHDDDVYGVGSTPGTGWQYGWSSDATNGSILEFISANNPLSNQTLPSGLYASEIPFDVLGDGLSAPGEWTLRICDNWAFDDGYLFSWGLVFEGDGEENTFSDFCAPGCNDPLACNFQSQVTFDDGSCYYPNEEGDCICPADADGDGICDDEDTCEGTIDECGVCAGPGAIYDCGCTSIPDWACNCELEVLDALGVCGGDCPVDLDMDGVCDDVDPCVGYLDDCGTCNGPILDGCCAGDVDLDGVCDDVDTCIGYEDAIGVCGGTCQSDVNGNGICDAIEFGPCENIQSVTYQGYEYQVVPIGDLCWFSENLRNPNFRNGDEIPAEPEGSPGWNAQYVPRRGIYNDSDSLFALAGYLYNYSAVVDPRELCPQGWRVPLYSEFVDMWDSFGNSAIPYRATGLLEVGTGYWDSILEGTNETGLAIQPFGARTHIGTDGGWGATTSLWSASTGLPQSGWGINFSSTSVGSNLVLRARGRYVRCVKGEVAFGCTDPDYPQYDNGAEIDDGTCEFIFGCTDPEACDYSATANTEDGTCHYLDECGVCGGSGIPEGFCDCQGNQFDALGVCGGSCELDVNQNGICDNEELVVFAEVDTTFNAGALNGYSSYLIYAELDSPLDAIAALFSEDSGLPESIPWKLNAACGCWNPLDETSTLSSLHNSVLWETIPEMELNEFDTFWTLGKSSQDQPGGQAIMIGDQPSYGPNICDQELSNAVLFRTPIDSTLDVAGEDLRILIARVTTCGPFYLSGNAQVYPSLNSQSAFFQAFSLNYHEGCTNPMACNYNPDALQDDGTCYLPDSSGECVCPFDEDADGVCDDVDECVGQLDECGVCNGSGAVFECGCSDVPLEACDCEGNALDAVGVCGGACMEDIDSDGVCDDVDDCVGSFDICGVCNGPGAVYECGCSPIPVGNCNCNSIDSNGDGICDDEEGCVLFNGSCCDSAVAHFDCTLSSFEMCTETLEILGGQISGLDFVLDHTANGSAWAADLMMYIEDEAGNCVVWGGYDNLDLGDCQNLGTGIDAEFWPNSWNATTSGIYTHHLDVSEWQLENEGLWIVSILNGYSGGTNPNFALDFKVSGLCGFSEGECQVDADNDGLCDIEDDCLGQYDDCGVCNGPGPILACGCEEIPVGFCDCEGNQADALGVCGGDCESDVNSNGICDLEELTEQGSSMCGPGTLWDPEIGYCIVAVPSDADFDGCVDTMDLLELLTTFDTCPGSE